MVKSNPELIAFIKEARARGFDDYEIRKPLLDKGWEFHEVERAFNSLKEPIKFKNKISVYIDNDVLKVIEKRAKKNMLSVSEQIEDIVRRSAVKSKQSRVTNEKLDDMLVALFSRKRR
jgi:hypothetical protein